MGSKRGQSALISSDREDIDSQPSQKRPRKQLPQSKKQQQLPQTDATYGQRCVFPGLDEATIPDDDDLEFEDEQDALAYLRSVRQEASGIPHLLVAPKGGPQLPPRLSSDSDSGDHDGRDYGVDRGIYENGIGDSRGYYFDGAYTAVPDEEDDSEDQDGYFGGGEFADGTPRSEDIQAAYFASLKRQFNTLRERLRQTPPDSAIEALPPKHETEVGPFGPRTGTFRLWSNRLRYTDPLSAQVAAMDKGSALRLLRIIHSGKFLRRGCELRERTSRWIWALLARLPDRGELDYVEIGWIRELGKRAVLMMTSIAQMAALREEVEHLDEGGEEELEELFVDEEDGESGGGGAEEDKTAADEPPQPGEVAADDTDMEEGEVSDDPSAQDLEADIAAAKARLLAQLDDGGDSPEVEADSVSAGDEASSFDETRARMNMRATLNMILTVAGEFYGQRDLLEFRDPFRGL